MRFTNYAVKPTQEQPQPVAVRPSGPIVPDKYRGLAAKQEQAEQNIGQVLGHVAPELAAEVLRRTAIDERFAAGARAGLDSAALTTVKAEVLAEVAEYERKQVNAGFRARLEAAKK